LKPLPAWIPEVYRLHERIVDIEGYVALHSNRYSVPYTWTGRRVEIRETRGKIEIQLDARNIVAHDHVAEAQQQRITLASHRPSRGEGIKRGAPPAEHQTILQSAPELASYLTALQKHGRQSFILALRQLLRMLRDYPRHAVITAIDEAARYGLYDMDRLERMILRRVAREYFLLDESKGPPDEDQ